MYEDETLISVDKQAGGKMKTNWTGGPMRARPTRAQGGPTRAWPMRAQGGP